MLIARAQDAMALSKEFDQQQQALAASKSQKLAELKAGYERGLDALLSEAIKAGNLELTQQVKAEQLRVKDALTLPPVYSQEESLNKLQTTLRHVLTDLDLEYMSVPSWMG